MACLSDRQPALGSNGTLQPADHAKHQYRAGTGIPAGGVSSLELDHGLPALTNQDLIAANKNFRLCAGANKSIEELGAHHSELSHMIRPALVHAQR
jgi:hypothetical protein